MMKPIHVVSIGWEDIQGTMERACRKRFNRKPLQEEVNAIRRILEREADSFFYGNEPSDQSPLETFWSEVSHAIEFYYKKVE